MTKTTNTTNTKGAKGAKHTPKTKLSLTQELPDNTSRSFSYTCIYTVKYGDDKPMLKRAFNVFDNMWDGLSGLNASFDAFDKVKHGMDASFDALDKSIARGEGCLDLVEEGGAKHYVLK